MPKSAPFVPRTLPPCKPERPKSRAQREREAKEYWDSQTEVQEVWALLQDRAARTLTPRQGRDAHRDGGERWSRPG
jgi:hypothetical protein